VTTIIFSGENNRLL